MKLVKISELFEIRYGTSLELNSLEQKADGINFVSRTEKNNGVSAIVKPIPGVSPMPAGVLTVALGGSVLETFLQPGEFYTGRDVSCLYAKTAMSDQVKLYYAACIRLNKYRYSYGRQANRTLKDIQVPDLTCVPTWVSQGNTEQFSSASKPKVCKTTPMALNFNNWGSFRLDQLFSIERGRGARCKDIIAGKGKTPFITSTDRLNGLSGFTVSSPCHAANVITLTRNGSVGEAFYQPTEFCSTEDVHVLNPKFKLTPEIGLFVATLLRMEKYRFNYGRKWGLERMCASIIRLPIDLVGNPDWEFMESYIKGLPYSSSIENLEPLGGFSAIGDK